jgi:hypothetical protein
VRVAVALAAGQAALCAVIGWVTFGPGLDHSHQGKPLDAAAAPPPVPVAPTTGAAPAPIPAPPNKKATRAPAVGETAPPRQPVGQVVPTVTRPKTPGGTPTRTFPLPSRSFEVPFVVPAGTMIPDDDSPSPSTSPSNALDGPQEPVDIGARCAPLGAKGVTADHISVVCAIDDVGRLRWKTA